jgi:outer membrane protein assembly factor BamD
MKRLLTSLLILPLMLAMNFLSGCSSTDKKDSNDPEVVYKEGMRLLKEHDYLIAEEYFSEVRRRFPQSRFAVLSQLASADLDYEQDNFLEAATSYGFFVDQFPRHEEAARAQFRRADSFFKAAPENVARDQTQINDALSVSRDFLRRYSASPFKDKILNILEKGRLRLAQKEAYVAAFYEKKDHNLAALRRWKGLQKDYRDIESNPKGAELLKRAETRIAVLEKAVEKE